MDDLGLKMVADQDLTVPSSEGAIAERALRLRQAVKDAGGNAAVSRSSGLPLNTLNRYLAGRDMKAANMIALAEATKVSLDWLASGRGPMRLGMAEPPHEFRGVLNLADQLQAEQALLRPAAGTVLISRYDARAGAGVPALRVDEAVIEKISFSESWVRTVLRRNPDHLALIECRGDSMEPTLRDGDVLMIDTSVTEVHSARIYVLDLDGSLIVKRVQRLVSGGFRIISDNKDRYEAETFTPSDRNPLRVVGEVVWWAGLAR